MKKSKNIIDRIKSEDIKPIPKWYFVGKNVMVWGFFIVSIMVGAAAFSVILFAIQQTDFNLTAHLSHSRLELMLGLLPFFWIIALVLFLVFAIFSIQNSKKGYKFTRFQLVGFSTAISILLGTLFFIGGGAQWLDNAFEQRMTLYESIESKKKKIWMNPKAGYLSGKIESVIDDSFILIDLDNKKWEVGHEDAFIPPVVFLEKGEQLKLVGKIIGEQKFQAEEVRPWGGPKHMKKMRERMKDKVE